MPSSTSPTPGWWRTSCPWPSGTRACSSDCRAPISRIRPIPCRAPSIRIRRRRGATRSAKRPGPCRASGGSIKYTLDQQYLRRVYPMLRAAAEFVVAYVKKGDDGKYHIVPTVSPENWGATVDYRLNRDCIIDLALTEFLLDAVLEGSKMLGLDAARRERNGRKCAATSRPIPRSTARSARSGWMSRDAPAEHVYNVPVTLAPVFPGEQVGLGSPPRIAGSGPPHRAHHASRRRQRPGMAAARPRAPGHARSRLVQARSALFHDAARRCQ